MNSEVVWTQWPDLRVPTSIQKLSPGTDPLETTDLSKITFYVPPYTGGREALELVNQMTSLKVLQVPNAGYDDAMEFIRPGITLCNARGVHDASTAELAVGLAISSRRGIPEFVRNQDKEEWNPSHSPSLSGSKIGIIGYGSIGQTIAKNLSGFDVEVFGFSRSGRDKSIPISELDHYLPTLDIVILVLPLNAESHHLFDSRRLSLLKDGALIVNVARGPIIDTDALIKELNSGRIYAALDVTDPEPLPKGHSLWHAKNLLIVPHVGGNSTGFEPRCRKLVEEQLVRFADGEELINIIVDGRK